jgi:nitrogen PTS system EIIA component
LPESESMLLMMRPPGAAMKISDLLSPADVLFDARASNKRALLQELAAKSADSAGLAVDQVTSQLLKREELGSTGIGRGVAIPHARLPGLPRPFGLLARLRQAIEFEAIDGEKVDLVFVLLLPAAAETEALGALALVARTLRSPESLARLRAAKNASELFAAMA